MNNGTLLVTGGAGFIGSFIVDRFIGHGREVRILDSLEPQVHPAGPPDYLNPKAEFVQADIRDRAAVKRALEGVDVVVHCAAAVGVAQSLYQVEHYVDVNVRGLSTLLDVLIELRHPLRKLVVLTSMTEYGEGLYRRLSDGAFVRVDARAQVDIELHGWEPVCPTTGEIIEPAATPENAALLARNTYALTKRYQEELALNVGHLYDIPTVCLRMFNVYGPRQSLANPYTGVLAIFLSRILARKVPVLYEDGQQTRDFISVHDVVSAVERAIDSSRADGQVVNLGSGTPRRIVDCAIELDHLCGGDGSGIFASGQFRKGDIRHCYADMTKARELLNFSPTVSWERGLAELLQWSTTAATSDHFDRAELELRAHGLVT